MERQKTIKHWQLENILSNKCNENQPAAGFIFGIQEPNFKKQAQKLGNAFKPSQKLQVLFDASSDPAPRAGILASSNLNLWMDTSYSNKDMCTARWDSGTEFGEILSFLFMAKITESPVLRMLFCNQPWSDF